MPGSEENDKRNPEGRSVSLVLCFMFSLLEETGLDGFAGEVHWGTRGHDQSVSRGNLDMAGGLYKVQGGGCQPGVQDPGTCRNQ